MNSQKLDALVAGLNKALQEPQLTRLDDAIILHVEAQNVVATMTCLRDDPDLNFKMMIDLTGVHYPDRQPKDVDVVYQLLSVYKNHRLRVKVAAGLEHPVPSVTGVWSCANWFERETYEMFGVPFTGHPDLRRLLTEYDFEGYPLRKEFPLVGNYEVRYDEKLKRMVREPVKLARESRVFYQA